MAMGEQAFEHKMRRIIFNFISSNPGSSFTKINQFMEMNPSTLQYHLNYLEKGKKVFSKKEGKKRCYYCMQAEGRSLDLAEDETLANLNKKQKRILNLVRKSPGISQKTVAKKLKLNQNTASYNLKRLMELGLIWKIRTGEKNGYEPVTKERLKEEILNRLILRLYTNEIDQETFRKIKKRLYELD